MYQIQVYTLEGNWIRAKSNKEYAFKGIGIYRGAPRGEFVYETDATTIAKLWVRDAEVNWTRDFHDPDRKVRVVRENGQTIGIYVASDVGQAAADGSREEALPMDGKPDITEPLKLDRVKVIERLNEIHNEEQTKREEAAAKTAEERQKVVDFLTENIDRVTEYVRAHATGGATWAATLDDLTNREFKDDNWEPKEAQPSQKESDTEKFARVLEMSNDETVALSPNQPLYDLL